MIKRRVFRTSFDRPPRPPFNTRTHPMISIDTPDFDQALAESRDGSFQRAVETYLERSLADVRSQLHLGLSPIDFEQAKSIEAAILKATDVIRFSVKSS